MAVKGLSFNRWTGVFSNRSDHYLNDRTQRTFTRERTILWFMAYQYHILRWHRLNPVFQILDNTPFESSSDSEAALLAFCQDINVNIKSTDIAACHRLPGSDKSKNPPLLIKLTNRKIRAELLGARKHLREARKNVYINEHLTKSTNTIYAAAHRLLKDYRIQGVWTFNGNIVIKLLNNKIKTILSVSQLSDIP